MGRWGNGEMEIHKTFFCCIPAINASPQCPNTPLPHSEDLT